MLNLIIYSYRNALPEWRPFVSAIQTGSTPTLGNKEFAAAATHTTSDEVSCLQGV